MLTCRNWGRNLLYSRDLLLKLARFCGGCCCRLFTAEGPTVGPTVRSLVPTSFGSFSPCLCLVPTSLVEFSPPSRRALFYTSSSSSSSSSLFREEVFYFYCGSCCSVPSASLSLSSFVVCCVCFRKITMWLSSLCPFV